MSNSVCFDKERNAFVIGDDKNARIIYEDRISCLYNGNEHSFEDMLNKAENITYVENRSMIANLENGIVHYSLEGMIYYIETTEDLSDAWVASKPIRYVDKDGYHCGWGLTTLCFKFEDLGKTYFFTRRQAERSFGR